MPEWKGSFPKAAPSRFPVVSEGERLVRKKDIPAPQNSRTAGPSALFTRNAAIAP